MLLTFKPKKIAVKVESKLLPQKKKKTTVKMADQVRVVQVKSRSRASTIDT